MTEQVPRRRTRLTRVLGAAWVPIVLVTSAAVSVVWQLTRSSVLTSDEAACVALARQPVDALLDDLRRLGLRPLWYLYEHGWIAVFGDGNHSVHLSTAVVAIAVLPTAYLAGSAVHGRELGALAVVASVASPLVFASGLDVGPDAQLILLVTLGIWSFARTMRTRAPLPSILLGLVTAALVWTHQWSVFPVIGAAVVCVGTAVRQPGAQRRSALFALLALVVGVGSLVPWTAHLLVAPAGAERVRPAAVLTTALAAFHGGPEPVMFLGIALALVGIFGTAVDERFVMLDFRTRRDVRPIAIALVAALASIALAGLARTIDLEAEAFATVLPLYLVLVAAGTSRLRGRGRAAAITVLLVGSTFAVIHLGTHDRTQVDAAVARLARRPDLPVVVCPPDLTTALRRELPGRPMIDLATGPLPDPPYLVVRDVEPDSPAMCREASGIAEGSTLRLLLEPDRDDSDEPIQVELVSVAAP